MLRKLYGCALVAITLLSGCDSGLTLVPVSGKVTIDGTPLGDKSVMFYPQGDTPGVGGGGITKADGTYSVLAAMPGATSDQVGLPPGSYIVTVTEPMFPVAGSMEVQSSDSTELTPAVAPTMVRKREIPAAYLKQETSPLKIEVPENGGEFDLKLTSK